MFFGRKAELAALNIRISQITESGKGQFLIVRGRRQVGKSALFTRLVEQCQLPHVYFTAAKNSPLSAQLLFLTQDVRSATPALAESEALFSSPVSSWAEALSRIAICIKNSGSPSIVILDEFPWATEVDPSLDGVLQVIWDRELQHLPVLLVLVGSDASIMDRLSDHDKPLFGRTSEMQIEPLTVRDCALALPAKTSKKKPQAITGFDGYLITGGYPRLVKELANSSDPYAYVLSQLEDESNLLCTFAQRILSAEFDDSSIAAQLLHRIGSHQLGETKFGEMVGMLQTESEATISRAIRQLVEVRQVVARDVPFGAPLTTRSARYRIVDAYLRFWLRFIGPQIPNISRGRNDLARNQFERDWSTWRGLAIEPLVRESVFRIAPSLGLESVTSVGGWWTRNNSVEVDIAGGNKTEVLVAGLIKWRTTKPVSVAEVAELANAVNQIPHARNAKLLVVSLTGIAPTAASTIVLNAHDLLEAWTPR
jgi:uncharacterized protein